jgi:DNA-binding CsgD family transcriptional regulator
MDFPTIIRDIGGPSDFYDRQCSALEALYQVEIVRARGHSDIGMQWATVADALADALLPWEETYSCWRAAEALLTRGHHHREQAATLLRRGFELSERLGAQPLRALIASLAETARIPLDRVTEAPTARLVPYSLTPREREILDHVIAGRTYSEIARALVISEKTVSSHISNLLRKTGTANRVDLARLAIRALGAPES